MQTQLTRLVQDDQRQARVSVAAALPLITQAQADRSSSAAEVQAALKAAADTYGDLATPQVRTASPDCCCCADVLLPMHPVQRWWRGTSSAAAVLPWLQVTGVSAIRLVVLRHMRNPVTAILVCLAQLG